MQLGSGIGLSKNNLKRSLGFIFLSIKNFMSIAKVHNFKGLSKFERVGGKKKIWLREGKNVKNFEWGDIVGLRLD